MLRQEAGIVIEEVSNTGCVIKCKGFVTHSTRRNRLPSLPSHDETFP